MQYLFIGNRFSVLEHMLEQELDITNILIPEHAYVQGALDARALPYRIVRSKAEAIDAIAHVTFDVLVSNGCPYILPVSSLAKPHQRFVNIHPSALPDLKGIHPINGALLFGRPAGAACHVMDDSIDGGPLISRTEIPLTPDIDLARLYTLSFKAERDVFAAALVRDFVPDTSLNAPRPDAVYYTRKAADLKLDFNEATDAFIRRVRAFGIPSQGAYFTYAGADFKVMKATPATHSGAHMNGEIVAIDGDSIIVRKAEGYLMLSGIIGNISALAVGVVLR